MHQTRLKPSDFLTHRIGTLAPFVEILALSFEILAPFGPILAENGRHGSEALSVHIQFLDLCVVSDSLHHADHSATMSCIRRHTPLHICFSIIDHFMLTRLAHSWRMILAKGIFLFSL